MSLCEKNETAYKMHIKQILFASDRSDLIITLVMDEFDNCKANKQSNKQMFAITYDILILNLFFFLTDRAQSILTPFHAPRY